MREEGEICWGELGGRGNCCGLLSTLSNRVRDVKILKYGDHMFSNCLSSLPIKVLFKIPAQLFHELV